MTNSNISTVRAFKCKYNTKLLLALLLLALLFGLSSCSANDEKFNYKLTLNESNELADQSMETQMCKCNHDNQLKQMKDALNELESRYAAIFNELKEQLKEDLQREQKLLSKQQQQAHDMNKQVDSGIRASFSDEHVSFKKIEEYINRALYLYNADKTGMADFASESNGGRFLFTRNTKSFVDESVWFAFFGYPIVEFVVSPRVVIQVNFCIFFFFYLFFYKKKINFF